MGALLRRHYKNEVIHEDKEGVYIPPKQEHEGIAKPPEAVDALFGSKPDLPVEPIIKEKHNKNKLKE